jgi:hypothetical protein
MVLPGTPTPRPGDTNVPAPVPGAGQDQAMTDAFARAPEGGTEPSSSYNPAMFGDLIGLVGRRVVVLQPIPSSPGNSNSNSNSGQAVRHGIISVVAPVPARAAFKISENESPRPMDRIYLNYNFYSDATRLVPGSTTSDLHRETLGFEKTFADGNGSFGFRLPFQQLEGDTNVQSYELGDMDLLFKYAFINDCKTGDCLSGGLVVTLPTGKDINIDGESTLHSWIFQPWLGFIATHGDWYVHGFSSVAIPTDFRDVTVWFNSIGVGYWIYRNNCHDAFLRGIVPTAELHVDTPLNHRGLNDANPISYPDQLNGTVGAHLMFSHAVVGLGVGTPLIGPRPYEVEAIANLGFHW